MAPVSSIFAPPANLAQDHGEAVLEQQTRDQELHETIVAQYIEGERRAMEFIECMAHCDTSSADSIDQLVRLKQRLQHDMHGARAHASGSDASSGHFPEPTGHVHIVSFWKACIAHTQTCADFAN
jgi:hypothetical protein